MKNNEKILINSKLVSALESRLNFIWYVILASEKEISKATEAEQKFQSIKRELDDFKLKNKKQKVSQNDVRLQRALEEVTFFLYKTEKLAGGVFMNVNLRGTFR